MSQRLKSHHTKISLTFKTAICKKFKGSETRLEECYKVHASKLVNKRAG